MKLSVRPLEESDKKWLVKIIKKHWGSTKIISRGKIYLSNRLPGFVVLTNNKLTGLIIYNIKNRECEIITLNSVKEKRGIGSLLVETLKKKALQSGCRRLWCITTNDNLSALRFYQNRGFSISAIYPNALEISRQLKPEIPLIGKDGIPLRDEIELEIIMGD